MTLEEWLEQQERLHEQFVDTRRQQSERHPNEYSANLTSAEWDEEFRAWVNS